MSNQNSNQPRITSANKMLIDATHPEETRVVVLRSGRVEEFDYESAARKLLRGNIYLAKVTRVEPSLQAAFVDYGGNRHGFLAFNEIHPDYYQIPVADRRALIEAEAAAEAEEEAAADRAAEAAAARRARRQGSGESRRDDREGNAVEVSSLLPPETIDDSGDDTIETVNEGVSEHGIDEAGAGAYHRGDEQQRSYAERADSDARISEPYAPAAEIDHRTEPSAERASAEPLDYQRLVSDDASGHRFEASTAEDRREDRREDSASSFADDRTQDGQVETVEAGNGAEAEQIETVSVDEDAMEEVPVRPRRRLRSYKIQEVTKRRQVLLVQVVKEERGTKGAALTTYLSLAGRYTVLMPNTARGGGISRKITNPQDRKRLKAIAAELDVPEGMGLIIRTAGAARTKQEIKRDYEYLLRLWESVRELALGSNAPQLVYEEGNLIKRSIRDLYGKEVEEIVVAGDVAHREAKDFMRMLMPSHAKNVLNYQDAEPLFSRYQIERQLNAMFSPYVHLKSGGYLVINQTEALVAIDINSGKSTREFSIEETAYSTNMEAADEIARQLKLRDLAGLIVIDFIDMEEKRNNRSVERRLKDALRHDRARIQLGRISHFGLLEMSRQRMRTGVLEGSTTQCPHCQGTGTIRSTESVALGVLRGLEDALMAGQPTSIIATTTASVALYILNNKRAFIVEMENRYGITIQIQASDRVQGANFNIERLARREEPVRRPERTAVNMEWGFEGEEEDGTAEAHVEDQDEGEEEVAPRQAEARGRPRDDEESSEAGEGEGGDGRRKRRRRRRGRKGEDGDRPANAQADRSRNERPHGNRPNGAQSARLVEDDAPGDAGAGQIEEVGYPDEPGHHGDHDHAPVRAGRDDVADDRDDSGGEPGGQPDAGDGQTEEQRRSRRRRRGRRGGRRGNERGNERDRPVTAAADGANESGVAEPISYAGVVTGGFEEHGPVDGQPRIFASSEPEIRVEPAYRDHAGGHAGAHAADVIETAQAAPEPVLHTPMSPSPSASAPMTNGTDIGQGHAQPAPTGPAQPAKPTWAEPIRIEPARVEAAAPPPPPTVSEPVPSPRSQPVASEPVLERVVVGPNAAIVQATDEAARPSRRGWWQRK